MRLIKYCVLALAFLLLLATGISLFGRPADEVLYTPELQATCVQEGCFATYRLQIGNSGRNEQRNIRVVLNSHILDETVLPLKAKMFGKVPREFSRLREGERTVIELGSLAPGKRVELSFSRRAASRDALPTWEEAALEVEAPYGAAAPGHAESVTFGRWMVSLLDLF